jgi:hypothetical protein
LGIENKVKSGKTVANLKSFDQSQKENTIMLKQVEHAGFQAENRVLQIFWFVHGINIKKRVFLQADSTKKHRLYVQKPRFSSSCGRFGNRL